MAPLLHRAAIIIAFYVTATAVVSAVLQIYQYTGKYHYA